MVQNKIKFLLLAKFSDFMRKVVNAGLIAVILTVTHLLAAQPMADSTVVPRKPKRFWRASGELMVAQLLPWSYNMFVRNADFAEISFKSIGENLKPSAWTWDDNLFGTNQIAHPYHGNLYYSAFRSNGYSFWESVPAAFAGSFIWETMGETHPPAPNDFINTSFGGIALGEMTYRVSNHIINNRRKGFNRHLQEVTGLLINPVNGLNRILDGEWGRVMPDPEAAMGIKLRGQIDIGSRRFSERTSDVLTRGRNELFVKAHLQYGDPFIHMNKPYDNFAVKVEGGDSDSSKVNVVQVYGFLAGKKLKGTATQAQALHLAMMFDFYDNTAFYYGAQSLVGGWLSSYSVGAGSRLTTYAGVGAVVLAAVPDEYLFIGEGRDYNFGPGLNYLGSVNFNFRDKLEANIAFRGGWFNTISGNESSYFLSTAVAEVKYNFTKRWSVALEAGQFKLNGYYDQFENTRREYPYGRLSAGYRFEL